MDQNNSGSPSRFLDSKLQRSIDVLKGWIPQAKDHSARMALSYIMQTCAEAKHALQQKESDAGPREVTLRETFELLETFALGARNRGKE